MSKAKREYVVWYRGENCFVYGNDGYTSRMTIGQAKDKIDRLTFPQDAIVYRLVPVATGRVVNGKFVERKKAKKKAARRAKADEPRLVKAPDGNWDIRTKTHYWSRRLGKWCKPYLEGNYIGGLYTKRQCLNSLPAARAAWKAMNRGSGKQGDRRAAS